MTYIDQGRQRLQGNLRFYPRVVDQEQKAPIDISGHPSSVFGPHVHLLDLQTRQIHTGDHVGEQGHHIVVAHSHVGDDLLESDLFGRVVLILPASIIELLSQLRNFPLW